MTGYGTVFPVSIPGGRTTKRIAFETIGWILVVLGIAALVLPGPGLLMLFAGMAILSQQYTWAERRLRPVERAAKDAARTGVATVPRIALSTLAALFMVGVGVVWGLQPPMPSWWPLAERWWLPGGWGFASSLIVSALIALGLLAYSVRKYRD